MKKIILQFWNLIVRLFGRECHYVGSSDVLPPPLDPEHEEALIANLGDEKAKQTLIEHNLRLVVYISKKFENTGVSLEDLTSIGTIGLIKAVNSFNQEKAIKLATYASRCIENEILMHLRKISNQRNDVSLDEPLSMDGDGNELLLSDILGTDGDIIHKAIEKKLEKEILVEAISKLSKREQLIISLRFGIFGQDEKTQKEVADMMGISQSYISRLEKKIIAKLKREMEKTMQ
ncbi:MAG: RNA polymerase sporulation sigma factor SigE [Ruminococcaceae bacterium]|nr:RNA polymerase sporulation sigma factor SigE [Oscillospiraceae bacterium]